MSKNNNEIKNENSKILLKLNNQTEKNSNNFIGVIAAQTIEAYYVYSPLHSHDIYLPKYLREFKEIKKAVNLGQWIIFKT